MSNLLSQNTILDKITSFYLESRDFNGISAAELAAACKEDWNTLHPILSELIKEDLVGVLFSDFEVNTHILRVGFQPSDIQIEKLETADLNHTCIYPRPKHLEAVVDRSRYDGEPYKLCLALGEPQLAYRSFDLAVLEVYRNDPRYLYDNDDVNGHISIRDEHYGSGQMPASDRVLLQSFGFSYDADYNRAVAVYLCYLADLSSEHQHIWQAKELTGDYRLHPDYYRNTIIGDWGRKVSIFKAFQKELYVINRMAAAMGRPPLFLQDFGEYGENKPPKLSFLIRPTLAEFNGFVLLLDKLLSDNINKEFFGNDVPLQSEVKRADGKIQVQNKGTLQILNEWIRKSFRTEDWAPWDDSVTALREVRKLRQKPAHALDEDVFDQGYFKKQRELIIRAYSAVRTLRMLLENHPAVQIAHIEIPDWLRAGDIWTY